MTIGRYFTPVEAHGCRMALENSGIPAWVLDETVGATFQVGVGTRLQVLARDEGAARAVLKEEPGPASSSSPDVDPDVEEPPDPAIEETRGRGAPAEEPPLFGNGGRLLTVETIELVAVVLRASAYPILSRLLGEPDDQRIRRGPLAAEILWFVGQTCVVWLLLRRKQGPLSPKPLPNSAYGWTMESALGLVLFAAVWALHSWLAPVLAGLPHPPSPWAAFFREPGVAPIFAASAFFAAVYEEVVFRAYFVSRLPLLLGAPRVVGARGGGVVRPQPRLSPAVNAPGLRRRRRVRARVPQHPKSPAAGCGPLDLQPGRDESIPPGKVNRVDNSHGLDGGGLPVYPSSRIE